MVNVLEILLHDLCGPEEKSTLRLWTKRGEPMSDWSSGWWRVFLSLPGQSLPIETDPHIADPWTTQGLGKLTPIQLKIHIKSWLLQNLTKNSLLDWEPCDKILVNSQLTHILHFIYIIYYVLSKLEENHKEEKIYLQYHTYLLKNTHM